MRQSRLGNALVIAGATLVTLVTLVGPHVVPSEPAAHARGLHVAFHTINVGAALVAMGFYLRVRGARHVNKVELALAVMTFVLLTVRGVMVWRGLQMYDHAVEQHVRHR